jgi:hypothetical protein
MESKYKLKQAVWLMKNNRPFVTKVVQVRKTKSLHEEYPLWNGCNGFEKYPELIVSERIDTEYEVFTDKFNFVPEKDLFPTKEELVMSLLK